MARPHLVDRAGRVQSVGDDGAGSGAERTRRGGDIDVQRACFLCDGAIDLVERIDAGRDRGDIAVGCKGCAAPVGNGENQYASRLIVRE